MNTARKLLIFVPIAAMACITAANGEFYNRAPDTLPGLLPEMRNPSYWIAQMDEPDEVIMSTGEIQGMNDSYIRRMQSPDRFEGVDPDRLPQEKDIYRWPGRFILKPDLDALSPAALADTVRKEIADDILFLRGKWMRDVEGLEDVQTQSFGNILGIEYAGWEIDELEREMARDQVADEVTPRDAVTVRDARLRIVPTIKGEHVGLMDNAETRWDVWNVNIVRIGSPVQVLHQSRTGLYVFALTDEGYGWIKSADVAFGDSEDIESFRNSADFAICAGDRAPFYIDESCTVAAGYFRMGDRLPLAPGSERVVLVPWRNGSGMLETARAWLAEDAQVSIGYLPYTRRNIVETAFRLLDNSYDWTMGWYGRNHETTLRDVFACFGFELPFNAELFTFYSDNNTRVVRPEEGKDAQYRAILANEPFVTIQTCGGGHSQLFLGEYNGEPVVLDTHGYDYVQNGVEYKVRRLVVGDMSLPTYFLETPFNFCELIGE